MQAVAKLSADNVVLLVKLRKAEARSSNLAEEVAVLRAAVESQSGTWFDDIHATVERATREGMQRADTLQVGTILPLLSSCRYCCFAVPLICSCALLSVLGCYL